VYASENCDWKEMIALPLNTTVNSKESQDLLKWRTRLEQDRGYLITLDSAESWPIGIIDDLREVGGPWHKLENLLCTTEEKIHRSENDSELQGNDILCYPLCTMESSATGIRADLAKSLNELMTSSAAWRNRVNQVESLHPREDKTAYMDRMHGLFKCILYEDRHKNRVSHSGSMEPYRGNKTGQRVKFRLDDDCVNSHEFYIGKEVKITPNDVAYAQFKGKLVDRSKRVLEISLRNFADTSTETQLNCEVISGRIEPIERDSLERQMESICNQKVSHFTNDEITKYILHDPEIRGRASIPSSVSTLPYDSEDVLNEVQREVVNWATQLKGLGLVAGPPGTGKTQTAAELVYELMKQRTERPVLVVSSSNAAVDVLLSRVVQCKARQDPDGTLVFG